MKTGECVEPSHVAWDIAKWGMYDSREELELDLKILENLKWCEKRKILMNTQDV